LIARILQRLAGVHRQERQLGADAAGLDAGAADVGDRLLHGVDRAGIVALLHRRPERMVVALEVLQAMAEIRSLVRRAFGIDQDRQVTAEPHCIHVIEEERAMAAEQVLHIVLRRRDQHVHAGLVHQPVKAGGVKRDRGRSFDGRVHVHSPKRRDG
jgi:hypothetical protein